MTTPERMARAIKALETIAAHEGPSAGAGWGMSCGCLECAPTAEEIKHPEWCAYRIATEALAVLREEQAPRWDAPTSDPLTPETMADALATLEEESARLDAGHVAALGIDPRRAHLVSIAPPPPCEACGGRPVACNQCERGREYIRLSTPCAKCGGYLMPHWPDGCPACRPDVPR